MTLVTDIDFGKMTMYYVFISCTSGTLVLSTSASSSCGAVEPGKVMNMPAQ